MATPVTGSEGDGGAGVGRGQRRRCGASPDTRRAATDSELQGEENGGDGRMLLVLERRGGAHEGAAAPVTRFEHGRELWLQKIFSNQQGKRGIGGREKLASKGAAVTFGCVEIGAIHGGDRASPASDWDGLAASIEEGGEGKWRRGRGVFVGPNGGNKSRKLRSNFGKESDARFSAGGGRRVTSAMTSQGIFFFLFLISFITFDLNTQMESNKFLKICNIHIYVLKH